MEKTAAELVERRRRLTARFQKVVTRYRSEMEEIYRVFREEMECPHPDASEFKWEHDNGYGTQRRYTGWRCNFCGAEDRYRTGNWIKAVKES